MTYVNLARFARQSVAASVAAIMAVTPMFNTALAAPPAPKLADSPLVSVNLVPANLMFTLDNSGSMGFHYLPDYTADFAYCKDAWDIRDVGGNNDGDSLDNNIDLDGCDKSYTFRVAIPDGEADNVPGFQSSAALYGTVPMVSNFNKIYYTPNSTYRPGKDSTGADLPQQNATTTTNWTAVRVDPYRNTTTTNLASGYPEVVWCVTDNPDIFAVADLAETLCRRNGRSYSSTTAAATTIFYPGKNSAANPTVPTATADYNYPNTSRPTESVKYQFTGGVVWCTTNNPTAADLLDTRVCRKNGVNYAAITANPAHPAVDAAATPLYYPNGQRADARKFVFPRHPTDTSRTVLPYIRLGAPYYYLTSVDFCDTRITTGVDRGFGTAGTCVNRWDDTTYRFVRYRPIAAGQPTFKRVDIIPSVTSYTAPNGTVRTYAEEMTNFANWYSYARFRMLAMKTAASIAFSALSQEKFSVGFHVLNNPQNAWVNVAPFTAAQKSTWFSTMFGVAPSGGTPSIDAHYRVGEYFRTGVLPLQFTDNTNPPSVGTFTGSVTSTDPLGDTRFNQCQLNYHLLSTDGYWNQPNFALGGGAITLSEDRTVSSDMPANIPSRGIIRGSAWPRPYLEGVTTSRVSLTDVATYYWTRDLRSTIPNRVPGSTSDAPNWQRLSLYGLALGAEGRLDYPAGKDQVTAGTRNWGEARLLNPDAIDDMWHASVNSEGLYLNAQSPEELATALVSALSDIANKAGTNAAQSLERPTLTATNKFTYKTGYEAGWHGALSKIELDPATAQPIPTNSIKWNYADQLRLQSGPYEFPTGTPRQGWNEKRRIITLSPTGSAVPFRTASLGANLSTLGSTAASQTAVLNFLRGDSSNEGNAAGQFRIRRGPLGDIVDSEAIEVGPPNRNYQNLTDPGYVQFRTANASRKRFVYVGANDGMMHAVDADTGFSQFSYVPRMLFRTGPTGLAALTLQQGGIPSFDHKYYVNATPRVQDVDFARTANASGVLPAVPGTTFDWRTILVGGMGKGGRGYYALDITRPGDIAMDFTSEATIAMAPTEAAVASAVGMWEFTDANDADMGYTYSRPVIGKTYAHGWVVIASSGYNSPTGKGALYVLNAKTGALIKKMTVPGGSATDPINLAAPAGYTITATNQYVEQVYAGDRLGNVWRFDISDPNPNNWKIAKIAELKDASGVVQAVTAAPQIEIDPSNDTDRYVFIGTGKILHPDDYTVTQQQTFYAIRDGGKVTPKAFASTPAVTPADGGLPVQRADLAVVTNQDGVTGAANVAKLPIGWYRDLPVPATGGSRKVIKSPIADIGVVSFSATIPSTDFCSPGFDDIIYGVTYASGRSVIPASATGGLVDGVAQGKGTAGLQFVQTTSSTGAVIDVFIRVTDLEGGTTLIKPNVSVAGSRGNRMTWRILN